MTAEEPKNAADKDKSPAPSNKTSSSLSQLEANSPRSADQESLEDYEESTKIASPAHSTRKRSTSQLSKKDILPEQNLPPISTAIPPSGDSLSQICLCQRDPKVPRPRNAFILYRQHHQATVVAQNPGLANPDISKIIGDHWRSSSPEIKNHWKILAEEEKIRHQRQYPDYRYQPRRSGRNNSVSSSLPSANSSANSSANGETPKCAKCGGRSITTPSMSTPALSAPITPMTAYAPSLPPPTPSSTSSAGRFLQLIGSPRTGAPGYRPPRPSNANGNMGVLQLASPRDRRRDETESSMSPDPKRRRFTSGGQVRSGSGQLTPFPFPQRRESLPRPDFMPQSRGQFTMCPPPRPHGHAHDASLTLPPLQTATASSASSQAKSVEAMVMSIPQINKVKVLAKISPPLRTPGPTSPTQATRGSVVAVDGPDRETVDSMVKYLSSFLAKSNEHTVRVFEGPLIDSSSSETRTTDSFLNYLEKITEWHKISSQMVKYITDVPSPPSPSPVSPKTITTVPEKDTTPPRASSSPKPTSPKSSIASPPSPPSSTASHPIPIAIIPQYQLSHTDSSSSKIPITDAYAPVDHWQWMATLWRGIVGPDITVIVKDAASADNKEDAGRPGGAGTGVEVRLADARAILVRSGDSGVPDGALRRVGFEVGEWVRGIGERERDGRRGS